MIERSGHTAEIPYSPAALARHGEAVALVSERERLTYTDLAERVRAAALRLGGDRRLVLLVGANDVAIVVHYLAALAAGHVVLLCPCAAADRLTKAFDPDIVLRPDSTGGVEVHERRPTTAHELHPDLALLLSTSGSTGSPKLVRLSYDNLHSNAGSIADYLGLRPDDRGVTSLPISYCYGLSIVHSHLLAGAALLVTDASVSRPEFWSFVRDERATSLAGVPYTFDLLDRVGFDGMDLPHLRRVTQAGGRLDPTRVRALAHLGRRRGWDLFVMYGQTEATARMAYLPPDLAADNPGTVGIPIPGGSFRLELGPTDPSGVGELVYRGRNVMLGYASEPSHLAAGRTVVELRTGDLARRTADGLYEIVGRRTSVAKIFGLRIDLEDLERELARAGTTAWCLDGGDVIHVVTEHEDPGPAAPGRHAATVALLSRASGLPRHALRLHRVAAVPRLPNGKPDRSELHNLVAAAQDEPPVTRSRLRALVRRGAAAATGQTVTPDEVRTVFVRILGSPAVTDESTFVSLGGDSLSYVELSLRLEELLGRLPSQWHLTSVRDLADSAGARRTGLRKIVAGHAVETGLLLRAVGIVLIVGSHANVFDSIGKLEGGAHALIGLAGFNVARFCLGAGSPRERVRRLLVSTGWIAVPSAAFILLLGVLGHGYPWPNLLLLNSVVGTDQLGPPWQFWFLEALVQLMLALALLLCVPAVNRWQRRAPFAFALAVVALGLVTRFGLVELTNPPHRLQSAPGLVWLFGLGLAAASASRPAQRVVVSLAALWTVHGFFGEPRREAIVLVALLLLVWVRTVRCPLGLHRVVGLLAANTLYIYLTHWHVFPHLQERHPQAALLASLVVGIAYGRLMTFLFRTGTRWTWPRRQEPPWSPAYTPVVQTSAPTVHHRSPVPSGSSRG